MAATVVPPRRTARTFIVAALLLLVTTAGLSAQRTDTLTLDNGDRITGEIKELAQKSQFDWFTHVMRAAERDSADAA